jgi:hypothetical protein
MYVPGAVKKASQPQLESISVLDTQVVAEQYLDGFVPG